MPNSAGLDKYWDDHFQPALDSPIPIQRIVLVDHSGTGQSLNGFRLAFEDILNRAYQKQKISQTILQRMLNTEMVFINIVDFSRRPGGPNPATPPTHPRIRLIKTITLNVEPGEINRVLGDEGYHYRVRCQYYPRRWGKPINQCWAEDGGRPQAIYQAAEIENYNRIHGGLIRIGQPIAPGTNIQVIQQGPGI